jgi:hypothetical protein
MYKWVKQFLKTVNMEYCFLHFKKLTRCVHQTYNNIVKFGEISKVWNLIYSIFFKTLTKDENYFLTQ